MRSIQIGVLVFAAVLLMVGAAVSAQQPTGTGAGTEADDAHRDEKPQRFLVTTRPVNLEILPKSLENGELGLDYELSLSRQLTERKTPGAIGGTERAFVQFSSVGYTQLTEGDEEDDAGGGANGDNANADGNPDSIVTKVAFLYSRSTVTRGHSEQYWRGLVNEFWELMEIDEPTPAQEERIKYLERRMAGVTGDQVLWLIMPEVHAQVETDDRFNNEQWVGGAGITTDTDIITMLRLGSRTEPFRLHTLLDSPFSWFREGDDWNAAPVVLYMGLDYVSNSNVEAREALTDDDEFLRPTFQAYWETLVAQDIILTFRWRVFYEIDAPEAIKDADLDLTSFFEVSAEVPVIKNEERTKFVIKYTDGALPPTLGEASTVSVGLKFTY